MAADSSPAGASGDLVVFAAASLTQVFNQIAGDFEASHPGVKISLQFDGSSTLARQIVEGAPADVFASADQTTMDTVVSAGLIVKPVDFTSNSLVLAVPAGNPAGITSIDDLADPAVALLVCAPDVPCGSIATRICDAAGLTVSPVSQEPNVSAVVTKLELGEADAGFVYSTDVAASDGQLVAIDLSAALTGLASTTYPLGIVQTSANPQLAEEFTTYLLGDDAREILAQAGFGAV
jgi:molybdate transport system substrate-binding protein